MSIAFVLLSIVLALSYILLIGFFTVGWYKAYIRKNIEKTDYPFISVIIPFRNEASNLPGLIQNLKYQDYLTGKFEILFSDDFSDDNSAEIIIEEIGYLNNFHIINSYNNDKSGKKAAVARALKKAKGDIIVNTDADCIMNPQWLTSIGHEFRDPELQMLLAPLDIDESGKGIFSGFQSLEFMSLMGSTGGSANMGYPLMANGANMAIRMETILEVQEKVEGKKLLSGDDMFLLQAVKKLFPGKVRFLKNRKSIVKTKPANTLKEFFMQRARWSSKSTAYRDVFTIFTGGVVATINILMVLLFLGILLNTIFLKALAILWFIKLVTDFPLLAGVARFIGKTKLLWLYVPLQFIYPFYVTTTLLLAVFTRTKWKDRVQN